MSTDGHDKSNSRQAQGPWTFFTNHSHVLVCLARDPHVRLRDVADLVGITERAVQRIVMELEAAGIIERQREGRRNVYRIDRSRQLRHPLEAHRTVGDLLDLINTDSHVADEPHGRLARPIRERRAKYPPDFSSRPAPSAPQQTPRAGPAHPEPARSADSR